MVKHKHHIIPKHAGGADDPSNLIELTVEEHAEAHRVLYETYGRIQDKVAYLGLANLAPTAELVYILQTEGMRGKNNPMFGKPAHNRGLKRPGIGGRKKGTKWSDDERLLREQLRSTNEYKEKMAKVYADDTRNSKIGSKHKGKIGAARNKVWYNNGVEEKYFLPEQEPKGFNRGRLSKK